MRIGLPHGYVDSNVIDMIDTILEANTLPRISRKDRIRGYIDIPTNVVNDVVRSLQVTGLLT